MSQHVYQVTPLLSIVSLGTEIPVVELDGCLMLDNYRGIAGTVTIFEQSGPPGQVVTKAKDIAGEHGWADYAKEYGFVIVPTDPDSQVTVIRAINKSGGVRA